MPKFNRLFIAEKASVGKALADYLAKTSGNKVEGQNAFAQVGSDVITWMSGHLLEQVEAHAYDPRYEKWNLADLPIIPNPFRLMIKAEPRSNARAKVDVIRKLLSDCTTVVGYGDPDAEGQLLQDELLIFLNNKKPVVRLWANALDDATLSKALASMKPNQDYIGWYEAALSRSQADWLYGINLTRACTLHARNAGADFTVTIGRVQTPTLALVVNRELEIRNFKPVDYHVPFIDLATTPGFRASWQPLKDAEGNITDERVDPEGRILDKTVADAIVRSAAAAGQATVLQADTKAGTEAAPLPFSLSSLQSHCSRLFGFSAKQTLDVAQSLYTKKITSYPRVDCDYLPESQHGEAPRILASLAKAQLPTAFAGALLGAKPALKSRAWNDSKVTAHHAIVPIHLDNPGDVARLDETELKVYFEIIKRYILQFWPAAKFNATEVLLACGSHGEERYAAKGRRFTDEGWRKAFALPKDDEEEDVPANLPQLTKGQALALAQAGLDSLRTKPPKRFTDGTLINAMKNVHQYVKDPEYKKRLKESVGIGTEATRGSIIEGLVKRSFLGMKGKEFVPSDDAIRFISVLPDSMKTPDMTAMWQQLNDDVMARRSTHAAFIAKMVPWVTNMVAGSARFFTAAQFPNAKPRLQASQTQFTCFGDAEKKGCGAPLRLIPAKPGAYRAFFGCTSADCKKTFNEVAGKPVERAPAQEGTSYACVVCNKGTLRRRTRRSDGGVFWGCSNYQAGCTNTCNDLDGKPDLEGKTRQAGGQGAGQQAEAGPTHECPTCKAGQLRRRERNDKSGYFWGCSAWREGCKAIFNDFEGNPDLEGKTKQGGWRHGAPPQVKPRNSGHSSGYRGGRPVTPQMSTPAPK